MQMIRILMVGVSLLALQACSSTSALRGCELDHPYHQADSGFVLRSPAGMDQAQRNEVYKVPTPSQVADTPKQYLNAADLHKDFDGDLPPERCLLHPPQHTVSAAAQAKAAEDE